MHAGASGGALINVQGQVAGLVTSNTKHATLGTVPHLNFSIAAAALQPLVAAAQAAAPIRFQQLDVQSEALDRLWRLGSQALQQGPLQEGDGGSTGHRRLNKLQQLLQDRGLPAAEQGKLRSRL